MRRKLAKTSADLEDSGNRQSDNEEEELLLFPDFKETFDAAEVRKCHENVLSSERIVGERDEEGKQGREEDLRELASRIQGVRTRGRILLGERDQIVKCAAEVFLSHQILPLL
uniref:Uncharacterized protein n=1 Tax=Noccaea caerulescens TaxID=107243 RepID=A0A1J3J0M2_NOCCA